MIVCRDLKHTVLSLLVGHKLTEITDRGIELNKVDTENILLVDADYVVLSLGVRLKISFTMI